MGAVLSGGPLIISYVPIHHALFYSNDSDCYPSRHLPSARAPSGPHPPSLRPSGCAPLRVLPSRPRQGLGCVPTPSASPPLRSGSAICFHQTSNRDSSVLNGIGEQKYIGLDYTTSPSMLKWRAPTWFVHTQRGK